MRYPGLVCCPAYRNGRYGYLLDKFNAEAAIVFVPGSGLARHTVEGALHDSDLATARYLGKRLAVIVDRFEPT